MRNFASLVSILLTAGIGASVVCAGDAVHPAQGAAETWLAKVDAEEYASSWRDASGYFRGAVPEQSWVASLDGVRKPLGKMLSRKLRSADQTNTAPGAPDGNYVVLHFDTSFEHKQTAVETATFVEEKDGKWKAAGYFIQ